MPFSLRFIVLTGISVPSWQKAVTGASGDGPVICCGLSVNHGEDEFPIPSVWLKRSTLL